MILGALVTNKQALHDPLTQALLRHYGADTELVLIYDDDTAYSFPDNHPAEALFAMGDDSWGVIVGCTSSNGHLIVCANYGDHGDILFSPTLKTDYYINDLGLDREWVNQLSAQDLIIGKSFTI